MTQQIIEMQKEWRTIGFAPQKMNVKIFERFRGACDRFFTEKAAFFKRARSAFLSSALIFTNARAIARRNA